MNRKAHYLTKTDFFTKNTIWVQLNTIIRKSQTLSDQGTESHSSIAECSSLSELASLVGFVEGWTAEKTCWQFFIVAKGEVYMADTVEFREPVAEADLLYRRGQHIMYKGEDAQVLEVKPVFTIRISGRSHVICGNIFNDVKPSAGNND